MKASGTLRAHHRERDRRDAYAVNGDFMTSSGDGTGAVPAIVTQ